MAQYFGTRHDALRQFLAEERLRAGISQIALAERLGWGQRTISKIETGEKRVVVRLCAGVLTPMQAASGAAADYSRQARATGRPRPGAATLASSDRLDAWIFHKTVHSVNAAILPYMADFWPAARAVDRRSDDTAFAAAESAHSVVERVPVRQKARTGDSSSAKAASKRATSSSRN